MGLAALPGQNRRCYLLRVSFAGHRIGQMWDAAGMRRRRTSGKARDREIETAPEKMHRTAFAAEAGAKLFQDPIGLQKDAPEAVGIRGIVGDGSRPDRMGSGPRSR